MVINVSGPTYRFLSTLRAPNGNQMFHSHSIRKQYRKSWSFQRSTVNLQYSYNKHRSHYETIIFSTSYGITSFVWGRYRQTNIHNVIIC